MIQTEKDIVYKLAEVLTNRVVKKCIRGLQKLDITTSNDQRLKSTWDEICVQIQSQHSFFWDSYVDIILNYVAMEVNRLEYYEQLAIYFQTDEAMGIEIEKNCLPKLNRVEVIDYITRKVYWSGSNWSNKGIRDYLKD
ncbi:hypothetical protein NU887_12025 [Aquiflexum sp. XJ19-11]|uniref:Uncharacterized protein n=2 Tax=Aquiflexum gelatinilyticum TaxID=2961943 RepID=A0A9X2P6K9_9BACT|nr:hypothetical protein [Aquiflexum gelatinilyticum]